jgi:hypothetical protein
MEKKIIPGRNKVSAYAAGGAFAVSLILGFVVKNPAGIVLMRAFFSGLLFGTLIRGGIFVLERFIPEVINRQAAQAESVQKVETESMENDTAEKEKFVTVSDGEEEVLDVEEIEEIGTDLKSEQETPEKVSSETASGDSITVEGGSSNQGEGEEVEEIDEEEAFSELPSIESLFEDEKEEIIEVEEDISKSPEKKASMAGDYLEVGNAQIPNEPETIAKAIRKVIKQD